MLRSHCSARVRFFSFCLLFYDYLLLTLDPYNPYTPHRMFKRLGALEKSSGGLNVSFLNTHPASDDRVKVTYSVMPFLCFDLILTAVTLLDA